MDFNKLTVLLGNSKNQTFELNYQIRKTQSAQIWAQCVHQSLDSGLRETNRFYNFPGHEHSNLDHHLKDLHQQIKALKTLHPELIFSEINLSDLKESVNDLHVNFAHSHHVTKVITDSNERVWADFNTTLHTLEAILANKVALETSGLPNARIVFTWNNSNRQIIPDDCYQDFVMNYEFGCAYANYSQVGRHFFEMFVANDDQLADEHIRPYRYISGDTSLFFTPTTGHGFAKAFNEKIKAWFELRQERFNKLGFFWGDPKLAIGQLPVARLLEPLYTYAEIQNFTDKISHFSKVERVYIE